MPVKNNPLIPISFLQSGEDLFLSSDICCKHPTVEEIFHLDLPHYGLQSEEIYYSMVNTFLTDPYTYMVFLDDQGIDYEQVTAFNVFTILLSLNVRHIQEVCNDNSDITFYQIFKDTIYHQAFTFFLGIDVKNISISDEKILLHYSNSIFTLDETTYNYIYEFIKKINGITDGERINPEDNFAKKILIEDERERLKKFASKNNENTNINRLGNLLSAVTWACNGGITPFNRHKLHIYDLVDGINRNDKLLNYSHTMTGLYNGTLNKNGIDFNKLHWST